MQSTENKYEWADNIRAIATISVIFLHANAPMLYKYGNISTSNWMFGNISDSIVRYCVPLFLMLSGALLIPKQETLIEFVKKRYPKLLIPFFVWSLFYLLLNIYHLYNNGTNNYSQHIWNFIKSGSSYHLWYIYMLLGIYLFIPIIGKWLINASQKEIGLFLSIWFITLFFNFPFLKKYQIKIDLTNFTGYIGYVVLGYFLIKFNIKKSYYFWLILFIIGLIITIEGTYVFTKRNNLFYKEFYSYLAPNIAVLSVGMFMIIKEIIIKNPLIKLIIKNVSLYSYGIYLAHTAIMYLLEKVKINWTFIHPAIGVTVTTILTLFFSWLVIFSISKLPYGKYISG